MEKLLVFYNKRSGKDEGEKLARWFQDYVKEKQPELYVELAETGPTIDDAELVKKAHYLNTMSDYFQVELSTTLHVFLRFLSKKKKLLT